MKLVRVIPMLLLKGPGLVKGTAFRDHRYIGDPINAVRIFNEKEVDELALIDISATPERRPIPTSIVRNVATECFMPLTVGGGITTVEQAHELLASGAEKVLINTAAIEDPSLVARMADRFGSQSVVAGIDVKSSLFGRAKVVSHCGTRSTRLAPEEWARELEQQGAGEIVLNAVDRDGTMKGYDLDLLKAVTAAVSVPVVAAGGAGSIADFAAAVHGSHASAVAAGAMFVFHGRRRAVLINVPPRAELERALAS